jgi:hypothetical protein
MMAIQKYLVGSFPNILHIITMKQTDNEFLTSSTILKFKFLQCFIFLLHCHDIIFRSEFLHIEMEHKMQHVCFY